jgi:hypothetical protein
MTSPLFHIKHHIHAPNYSALLFLHYTVAAVGDSAPLIVIVFPLLLGNSVQVSSNAAIWTSAATAVTLPASVASIGADAVNGRGFVNQPTYQPTVRVESKEANTSHVVGLCIRRKRTYCLGAWRWVLLAESVQISA